jgi:hypothetical protein
MGVITAINFGRLILANCRAWGTSIALIVVCLTRVLPTYHSILYLRLAATTQHLPRILHQLHEVVHGIAALPRFIRIHDRPETICDAAY